MTEFTFAVVYTAKVNSAIPVVLSIILDTDLCLLQALAAVKIYICYFKKSL